MIKICAFTVIATLVTGSVGFADPPAKAPADKKADKAAPDKAAPDKAPKKEVVSNAKAQKFYAFFEKLVSIVVANQDDCVKMASRINAHADANQAVIKEGNEAKNQNKDLPPAFKEKLEKKVRDEFVPALTKKCGQDKSVQAALERLNKT